MSKFDDFEKRRPPDSNYNSILDDHTPLKSLDLTKHIDKNSLLYRLSEQTAYECDLPISTVMMCGLGVFSTVSCRKYAVNYEHYGKLPISLYVIGEQPSGTAKSRCLTVFQKPFFGLIKKIKNSLIEELKDLEEDEAAKQRDKDDLKSRINNISRSLFINNTTPEALEIITGQNNGFFSVVSAEQGAIDSLIGGMYKGAGSKSNNDAVLHGFDGGFMSSSRVTRGGHVGTVVGGLVCFAQDGTSHTILSSSNGTGLAERFLFLAEETFLGKRDIVGKQNRHDSSIWLDYDKKCSSFEQVLHEQVDYDDINCLSISTESWELIKKFRQFLEPMIADGEKYAIAGLRGMIAKIDAQVMKIAANLHVFESSVVLNPIIDDKHILSALHICAELVKSWHQTCENVGITGDKAAYESILTLFAENPRRRDERNIILSKRATLPFRDFKGDKYAEIRRVLIEMVKLNLLQLEVEDGKKYYRV
ncbi:MAG: YfjI family protein [Methylobacter sp.]|uniref:DUF3987 domain-containing protein n=1 Tax=Methylobacter sp. TaxID=2051955 RepID=UPI0025DE34E5|nr:DUF3987 domain-containing protein [Methylobacter sp.]MCK9622020.1 YfjI family protein [Methylobacter sp.]